MVSEAGPLGLREEGPGSLLGLCGPALSWLRSRRELVEGCDSSELARAEGWGRRVDEHV